MYYKIVSGGQIVDVCDGLNFVRWQKKNSLFLACSNEAEAGGIISSDGSTIYLLEGAEQVNDLAYAHYAEIDEDTYNSLREQLIENGILDDPKEESPSTEEENTETSEPVAKSEERQLIESLQEQVNMLTECILEMSELVYV